MAWIELHQTVWVDKKTLIMASILNIAPIYVVAHMAHLWCWGLDNTPSGTLVDLPTTVIATGAGWTGDPDQFVDAAIKAGFIDRDPLALHDWNDYAGRLIERRKIERERSKQRRAAEKKPSAESKTTSGRPADDLQTACGTVPYRTVPNQDQKDHPASPATSEAKKQKPVKKKAKVDYTPEFERVYTHYPRKVNKFEAYQAYQAIGDPRPTDDELIASIERHKTTKQWQEEGGRYIPYMATFLNKRRWEDEPEGTFTEVKPAEESDELRRAWGD